MLQKLDSTCKVGCDKRIIMHDRTIFVSRALAQAYHRRDNVWDTAVSRMEHMQLLLSSQTSIYTSEISHTSQDTVKVICKLEGWSMSSWPLQQTMKSWKNAQSRRGSSQLLATCHL